MKELHINKKWYCRKKQINESLINNYILSIVKINSIYLINDK